MRGGFTGYGCGGRVNRMTVGNTDEDTRTYVNEATGANSIAKYDDNYGETKPSYGGPKGYKQEPTINVIRARKGAN